MRILEANTQPQSHIIPTPDHSSIKVVEAEGCWICDEAEIPIENSRLTVWPVSVRISVDLLGLRILAASSSKVGGGLIRIEYISRDVKGPGIPASSVNIMSIRRI